MTENINTPEHRTERETTALVIPKKPNVTPTSQTAQADPELRHNNDKELYSVADDVVRSIKITATGENVDATRDSTEKLSAAVTQLSSVTSDSAKAYKSQTDALNHHGD